jgi:hypothetical protein
MPHAGLFRERVNTGDGVEWLDGESTGMEGDCRFTRAYNNKQLYMTLLCLEMLVFQNFSVAVGCDCFLEVAGTGC